MTRAAPPAVGPPPVSTADVFLAAAAGTEAAADAEAGASAAAGAGAAAAADARAGAGASAASSAAPSTSNTSSSVPTGMTSPGSPLRATTFPRTGDGNSTTALSVDISAIG